MKFAVFGNPFSHTDQASYDFGRTSDTLVDYFSTIFEVFEAVDSGDCAGGVVPYENSMHGAIFETLEALFEYESVGIIDLIENPIHQCLMGCEKARLEGVQAVLSHPQALGQARKKLHHTLPQVVLKPRSSTALAAQEVKKKGDPTWAAIGSPQLAKHCGLEVLLEHLEGDRNRTKFVFVSKEKPSSQSLYKKRTRKTRELAPGMESE